MHGRLMIIVLIVFYMNAGNVSTCQITFIGGRLGCLSTAMFTIVRNGQRQRLGIYGKIIMPTYISPEFLLLLCLFYFAYSR